LQHNTEGNDGRWTGTLSDVAPLKRQGGGDCKEREQTLWGAGCSPIALCGARLSPWILLRLSPWILLRLGSTIGLQLMYGARLLHEFALEDAIELHAFAPLEALPCVRSNARPLGPLHHGFFHQP
jgi:hypothetical protein